MFQIDANIIWRLGHYASAAQVPDPISHADLVQDRQGIFDRQVTAVIGSLMTRHPKQGKHSVGVTHQYYGQLTQEVMIRLKNSGPGCF